MTRRPVRPGWAGEPLAEPDDDSPDDEPGDRPVPSEQDFRQPGEDRRAFVARHLAAARRALQDAAKRSNEP